MPVTGGGSAPSAHTTGRLLSFDGAEAITEPSNFFKCRRDARKALATLCRLPGNSALSHHIGRRGHH
jgi:hypothetical protein